MVLAACTPEAPARLPPPPELPTLRVDSPARASFLPEGDVVVTGQAIAGTGDLAGLTVGGAPAQMDADGSFSVTLPAEPGILSFGIRVEDSLGERAVDGRSVQVGRTHDAGQWLSEAVAMQMGPETLDDDAPDIDDFARVSELIVEDPAFGADFVGATIPSDSYEVTITSFAMDSAGVDLVSRDGALDNDVTLYGVHTEFDAYVNSLFITVSGWAEMDLVLDTELRLVNTADGVEVEVISASATTTRFDWDVAWVPEFIESLMQDDVRLAIEAEMSQQASDRVGAMFAEALAGFELDQTFGPAEEVSLSLKLARAEAADEGLLLWLDARAVAQDVTRDLPPGAGSLRTDFTGTTLPIQTTRPFVTAIDDDFFNQLLFAFWAGGGMSGQTISREQLMLMAGGDLPAPLGPVSEAQLDLHLPPVIMPPSGELVIDLAIGEFHLGIDREDGERLEASLNIRAPASLASESGGLSLMLDNRPAYMPVHAGMLAYPEALDPGDLASLFRLTTPTLMGQSSALFPALPAIELPVGETSDAAALQGVVWKMEDVDASFASDRWLVLESNLVEGTAAR